MLSKEERSAFNQLFWNGFKKEMRRYNTKHRRAINWLKYPTNIKHVYLRLHCDNTGAYLNFDVQFKDDGIRDIFWEQLIELKQVMEMEVGNQGLWLRNQTANEGFVFNRIQWVNPDVNYYMQDDWPKIYQFLKERLLAFDRFYQEFKDVLILLLD